MSDTNKKSTSLNTSKRYFVYFFVILVFVQILDTYNTHYINLINSQIIADFLAGYSENEGASIMSFCTAIATFGTYIVFFNQFFTFFEIYEASIRLAIVFNLFSLFGSIIHAPELYDSISL